METAQAFIHATRNKLRFASPQGLLSVEDLWDLPLSSTRANQANLDDIAIDLDKSIKQQGDAVSFVKRSTKTKAVVDEQARFQCVLHVIEVKQAEIEKKEEAQATAAKKQRILELIEMKKDADLAGKSTEELEQILKDL